MGGRGLPLCVIFADSISSFFAKNCEDLIIWDAAELNLLLKTSYSDGKDIGVFSCALTKSCRRRKGQSSSRKPIEIVGIRFLMIFELIEFFSVCIPFGSQVAMFDRLPSPTNQVALKMKGSENM